MDDLKEIAGIDPQDLTNRVYFHITDNFAVEGRKIVCAVDVKGPTTRDGKYDVHGMVSFLAFDWTFRVPCNLSSIFFLRSLTDTFLKKNWTSLPKEKGGGNKEYEMSMGQVRVAITMVQRKEEGSVTYYLRLKVITGEGKELYTVFLDYAETKYLDLVLGRLSNEHRFFQEHYGIARIGSLEISDKIMPARKVVFT